MALGRTSSENKLRTALERLIEEHDLDIEIDIEIADRFKRKAGQYHHGERKIRISRHLLENHPEEVIETIKHELGHALVMHRHGKRKIKPHGKEWNSMMEELGVSNPEACHSLQLTDYKYIVRCTNSECDAELGRYRKSRLVKKPGLYACKKCGCSFESFEVCKNK